VNSGVSSSSPHRQHRRSRSRTNYVPESVSIREAVSMDMDERRRRRELLRNELLRVLTMRQLNRSNGALSR
jgi:hypothetical protein